MPGTLCHRQESSPLCYGVGSCEDFAAALTVLLNRMGYQAAYVSGLTLSVDEMCIRDRLLNGLMSPVRDVYL